MSRSVDWPNGGTLRSKFNERDGDRKTYRLSPVQEGMLFHALYAPGSGADIQQIVLTFGQDLDIPRFTTAWKQFCAHHDVLRTSFRWHDANGPEQVVASEVRLPFEDHDWSAWPHEEQEQGLAAYLAADRRQGFELDRPPVFRLALFRRGPASSWCVWSFHHTTLDGGSTAILLEEVFALYEALGAGLAMELTERRPTATTSPGSWNRTSHAPRASGARPSRM